MFLRTIHLYIILISSLLYSICLTAHAHTPIKYPIEAFKIRDSEARWLDTVSITIQTKQYTGTVAWLYVKVNNLNDASTMKYRLKENGAKSWQNWQTSKPDFRLFPKDKAYGGLDGGFSTTQFATPISGILPNRSYQLQFRYAHIAGSETSGYRILDMALWLNNDKLAANQLVNQIANGRTDITGVDWKGPYETDADMASKSAQGGQLWRGEIGPQLIDVKGNLMTASCADCHTSSGWDLKYFNYSDKSIIARSNFHGLSRTDGEKIAQYIRDLSFKRSVRGRPWQPPFQPGPEADDDPFEWAAGQGLENVLDTDKEMLTELFGNSNPSKAEIRKTINGFNGNTNLRTQKLSLQFPDWNAWLPKVLPKDLVAQGIITTQDYQSINNAYLDLRSKVDTPAKVEALNSKKAADRSANNGIFKVFGDFSAVLHNVLQGKNSKFPRSPEWADNTPAYEADRERMKRSLAPWFSIKVFEVIHEFALHDISDLKNIDDAQEEAFQWPTREWVVFQNAAHIISETRSKSYFSLTDLTDDQQTRGIYLSSIWYQIQLTLTPGHRKGGVVNANDFAYNLLHVHRLGLRAGIYEPTRWLQNYIKTAEQRNNGMTPAQSKSGPIRGWNMRELSPWRMWGTTNGKTETFDQLGFALKTRVQEVFLDEIVDKLNSFAESDWNRVSPDQKARSDFELEYRNTIPVRGKDHCLFHQRRIGGGCSDANDAVEIDAIYTLLDLLQQDKNISLSVFNKLRRWADARWDYTDWPVYSDAPDQ